MAFLKGPIPENLPKSKEYIFRIVNGKCIISRRPKHYTISHTPEAVRARNHFAFVIGDEKKIAKRYRKAKLFLAVLILDREGKVVKYSSTSFCVLKQLGAFTDLK